MSETMRIDISKVRRDGGTQSREELNQTTVDEYGASMIAGDSFPAVKVFYDGTWYWLADGFHRVAAALQIKATTIFADVHQGTQRDAVLDSASANSKHGLRRTRDDVRRAIKTLLRDEEWGKWSDREIARKVHCDHKTVGSVRAELVSSGEVPQTERTVERNGTVYQMTPAAKPMVTNRVGRGFEIGDVVRYSEQGIWEYNYGQIAAIDGDNVTLNFAIKNRREANSTPETITISRLSLFPITQGGYQRWFCQALYPEQIVLFAWKDHYISLLAPRELNGGSHDWISSDGGAEWAWRIHPSWLEYWSQRNTSYVVVKPDDITPEMLDIVGRAGRARGGKMVMPPKPEAEPQKSIVLKAPEWATEGATVKHVTGKICRIQGVFERFPEGLMFSVEIIKPEDGYATAPAREFEPYTEPADTPEPTETTAFQVGDKVITRTGRQGEVVESNGLVRVNTGSYTTNHDPSKLKLVLRAPAAPAPAAPATQSESLMTKDDVEDLQQSVLAMFVFVRTRANADPYEMLQHVKRIRLATLRIEAEANEMVRTIRALPDPSAGGVAS